MLSMAKVADKHSPRLVHPAMMRIPSVLTKKKDLGESSMEAGGGGDAREERAPPAPHRDSSPPLVTNGDAASYREEEGGDTLPTDMSDTSDSEPDKPNNGGGTDKCTASHEGRQLLQQEVPFNIDQLFTMMFTSSQFNLELLAARGTTDYLQAPWQPQGGLKCRQISYKLGLTSGPIGPKEVHVTETQVMNKCSKPGVLYSIDACSENSGIPYADYFSVRVHYCLARVSDHATSLLIHAHLHYKKQMWSTVRGFLERNTISGLEQFCRLLSTRLQAEAEGGAPTARKARRQRRNTVCRTETATPVAVNSPAVGRVAGGGVTSPGGARARSNSPSLLGGALLLLLILNAGLYWCLHNALNANPADKLMGSLSGEQAAQLARVLQQHADTQRGHLRAWRHALDNTRRHLHQTEKALMKLLEAIKPSLEGAPPDPGPAEDPGPMQDPGPTPRPDL
ncbi:unnamed protein product [Chilo suppressalis]|uniref:VASt domain-containing protein n=1 Tax=Chilo suppressalis TaxID=168631 RepID=A0ABN8L6M4_CHISP|nr:unnamed protein product [Chilo suppressalis]